jgi:hypothetical protein
MPNSCYKEHIVEIQCALPFKEHIMLDSGDQRNTNLLGGNVFFIYMGG